MDDHLTILAHACLTLIKAIGKQILGLSALAAGGSSQEIVTREASAHG
jgi:hypothetical protein